MKQKEPYAGISYRLDPQELERGMKAAEAVGLANNDLARKAYIALVECIERNNFRVTLPLRFEMVELPNSEIKGTKTA